MRGRGFRISILVALLLLAAIITEAENPAEKIKVETAKVHATERAEINMADEEDVEEAEATQAQAADAEQFEETTNTVEVEAAEQKTTAQENGPEVAEDNDDLFTMEHLGLDIPVKSAVEALNMDVLKQMLLKKLTEKLGKYAKSNERKKKIS
ncbi:hypothetical protein WUBG_09360 [Wuchereria bancrofti]|uniref:Uncharacterized protein n=1 Tax=Wuchereria bancrofti TaxID=6293 RepID=J9ERN2_WUCBA|nr:hypothetical protein WUBG_09360 [Wuchereria bancrofti]